MDSRDYYDILGVNASSSADEIKRAYRKLVRQYHPDRNQAEEAQEVFRLIQEAYEVLGDADRRAAYDDELERGQVKRRPTGNHDREQTAHAAGRAQHSHDDLLRALHQRAVDKFEEEHRGGRGAASPVGGFFRKLKTSLGTPTPGPTASVGNGRARPRREGRVDVMDREREYQFTITATESLRDTKREIAFELPDGPRVVSVNIPGGVADGSVLHVPYPDASAGVGRSARVRIQIVSDGLVERYGPDIVLKVPISVTEALTGAEITAPALEGPVRIRVPTPWNHDNQTRLKGRGVRLADGSRGDLIIKTYIVLPDVSSPVALHAAQALDAQYQGLLRQSLPQKLGSPIKSS